MRVCVCVCVCVCVYNSPHCVFTHKAYILYLYSLWPWYNYKNKFDVYKRRPESNVSLVVYSLLKTRGKELFICID